MGLWLDLKSMNVMNGFPSCSRLSLAETAIIRRSEFTRYQTHGEECLGIVGIVVR